jgi:transcriptional regulator with XRE-family HTH domain
MEEEKIGDRVRKAREAYGMSATLLAKRAGITRQQLYMIETGKTADPGVHAIKAIAKVLRVSVDLLVSGQDTTSNPLPTALAFAASAV